MGSFDAAMIGAVVEKALIDHMVKHADKIKAQRGRVYINVSSERISDGVQSEIGAAMLVVFKKHRLQLPLVLNFDRMTRMIPVFDQPAGIDDPAGNTSRSVER